MYLKRKNKYGNRRTWRFGISFRSLREAEHATFLEEQRQRGVIRSWIYEKGYDLKVKGRFVGRHKPDFTIEMPDGRMLVHEVKSPATARVDGWRMRRELFKENYPDIEYSVHYRIPRGL